MNKLKEYLFYKQKSNTDFAKEIGVSRTHIQQFVSGKAGISRLLAQEIERKTEGEVKACDLMNIQEEDKRATA